MHKTFLAAAAFACARRDADAAAQEGAQAGDPMRIVIMVDNSQTSLTHCRRFDAACSRW